MGLLERANAARILSGSLLSRAQGYTADKKKSRTIVSKG